MKFVSNDLFNEHYDVNLIWDECNSSPWIVFDIETSRNQGRNRHNESVYTPGLDPWTSKICMLQIKTPKETYVIDARVTDISGFASVAENPNVLKIGHNLKFESYFLLVHLNAKLVNLWDTMIVEKILYNGAIRSYALASVAEFYGIKKKLKQDSLFDREVSKTADLNYKQKKDMLFLQGMEYDEDELYSQTVSDTLDSMIDKSTRMGFVNIGSRPFTEKEIAYGADDVEIPYKIYLEQLQGRFIGEEQYFPIEGILLENKVVPVLAYMQYVGIKVDGKLWLETYEDKKRLYIEQKTQVEGWVQKHHPVFTNQLDLFSDTPSCVINWGSPKQVIELFKKAGGCPREYSPSTGKEEYSVGAKALYKTLDSKRKEQFDEGIWPEGEWTFADFTLAFLLFKKTEQLCTTFGKDWLKYIHPVTGRVHTNFNQYMNTSRLSSTNPNLQNCPRGKEYRRCFIPEEGNVLIASDYNSQESRILAEVSGVPSLINFFTHADPVFKGDLHSFSATQMFRVIQKDPNLVITKNSDPRKRQIAKNLSFALSYGAGAKSMMHKLSCTEEEAEAFIQAYFDGFLGLQANFNEAKKKALERGWIQLDPYTDKRYFYPNFERIAQIKKEAWDLTPNYKFMSQEEREQEKIRLRRDTNWSALWKEYSVLAGKLERRALNYRIQGNAATMTKLALLFLYEKGIMILLPVHDEIVAEARIEVAQESSDIVEAEMTRAGAFLCGNVPMGATAEWGDHWIH